MEEGKISIHFLGAAGTVTGSKYLIDTGERKILIDCQRQGEGCPKTRIVVLKLDS